ncbi:transcriptional regulator, TetR family [Methanolacinia petrolearia DSM 11571]|uniref:Transcriptional regulator, TetR family n=1 Tax=Methanolacinia petrolearia (strain DSM 11571 / OCM 486 / SEBR 4847) TaxID=679926 RepID=E1RCY1_METP4|nr:TetR/AcrR family transcriptional regulator [Methanolacinia petrolearia]ADN35881.1 transcriptional regulator, TetR family [Methanolacinia petrolearia DSM 11571]
MNRELSKPDNRQKILDAALHLFTTRGFHATPTSAICKKADVASGTLFHYFPDKTTLIGELYLSIKSEMSKVFSEADIKDLPLKERTEKILWAYLEWGIENPEKEQFVMQFCNSPNIAEEVRKEAHSQFTWTDEIIVQGIKLGIFVDVPLEIFQVYLYRSAAGLLELIRENNTDLPLEELFNYYIHVFWNGVLK